MKKLLLLIFILNLSIGLKAQHAAPADTTTKRILYWGADVHTGNGKVIEKAALLINHSKIEYIQPLQGLRPDRNTYDTLIDVTGKQIYPGFIAMGSQIGLQEIELVRSTIDSRETGAMNPSARTLIAYNTDSRVTPTLRSNGVLTAQIAPEGPLLQGTSSVVSLDAWNWEDACIKADDGIWLNWPSSVLFNITEKNSADDQQKRYKQTMQDLTTFFDQANAYCNEKEHATRNLNLEAMCELFTGKKKLYIEADFAKDILASISFSKKYHIKMVLVGGADSWRIADKIKQEKIPVIIVRTQSLPVRTDDDIDLPYKLPSLLIKNGIEVAIADAGFWKFRNLGFEAGEAAGYGLTKEEALTCITLAPARILGIDSFMGSLEDGKDATLFISGGDALDMTGNKPEVAYIKGRKIDLFNYQEELYRRYMKKYGLKTAP